MKVLVLHMHQSYLVTCLSSVMSWISCVFYDFQWCSLVFLEVLITLHPNELTPCILINHISPFNHCQSATKVIYNPSGAIFFIISLREWNNFCSLPLNSSLNLRLLYLKCTYLCYAICSSKTLSTIYNTSSLQNKLTYKAMSNNFKSDQLYNRKYQYPWHKKGHCKTIFQGV